MFDSCTGCQYWFDPECHRFPPKDGYPLRCRGCGEYKEKEVIIRPAEEKKEESPKVESVESKWACEVCGQVCKSALGLHAHKRQHK